VSYYSKRFDDKVVKLIKGGAVGFMPSDTIYGLSCVVANESSVGRAASLKGRAGNKPFIILIADIAQACQLGVPKESLDFIKKFWPAPITFVADTSKETPKHLHKDMSGIALRMPADDALSDFIKKVGPIVSISANYQGKRPIDSVTKAKKSFGEELDFYVDVGRLNGEPSTIIKLVDNKIKILWQGAYKFNSGEIGKNL
jgi:L-threonylcarbamoyladenylate synthase